MRYKVLDDNNISKFIFETDDMVAESVLYKYNSYKDRTVICCSVQSGCKIGCSFCGTGKHFVRNLTSNEIVNQVNTVIKDKVLLEINDTNAIAKFQIMFMSMGEPFDNYENLKEAIYKLNELYLNAQLFVSTTAPLDKPEIYSDFMELSQNISNIGLQFSIHRGFEEERNKLIPYKNKMSLGGNKRLWISLGIKNQQTSLFELLYYK